MNFHRLFSLLFSFLVTNSVWFVKVSVTIVNRYLGYQSKALPSIVSLACSNKKFTLFNENAVFFKLALRIGGARHTKKDIQWTNLSQNWFCWNLRESDTGINSWRFSLVVMARAIDKHLIKIFRWNPQQWAKQYACLLKMSKLSSLGFLHTRRNLGYFAIWTAGSAESSPFYIILNTGLHFNQSALCQRSLNLGTDYMEAHMFSVLSLHSNGCTCPFQAERKEDPSTM